jgi:hypothetical protein
MGRAVLIRKGLVVFQFTVAVVFILLTLVVLRQLQHVKNRQLGFDKNNLLEITLQGEAPKHVSTIQQALLRSGGVAQVAAADHATLYGGDNTTRFTWNGKEEKDKVLVSVRNVSPEFVNTFRMRILQGRNFHPDARVESHHILVTQSLTKAMGKASVLGEIIRDDTVQYQIVGVVEDFVYGNMYGQPDPVIFFCQPREAYLLYIRPHPQADLSQTLPKLEGVMKQLNPGYPFQYRFADEQFNQLFENETVLSKLARMVALLTILISCLGLFGLVAYTAERRTKEIGIRKVLGASMGGIVSLLSWDFLKLIILANLLAWPLAWYGLNKWLANYAYRISLSLDVFLLSALLAVVIALVTISAQTIKAALANPVNALRQE